MKNKPRAVNLIQRIADLKTSIARSLEMGRVKPAELDNTQRYFAPLGEAIRELSDLLDSETDGRH